MSRIILSILLVSACSLFLSLEAHAETVVIFSGAHHLGDEVCSPDWNGQCFEDDCAPRGQSGTWTFEFSASDLSRLESATLRIESQDAYYGSSINLNGNYLGSLPPTWQVGCTTGHNTIPVLSYIIAGTNSVTITVPDEVMIRDIELDYSLAPPPDVQIHVTSDQDFYQNGVDIAQITVETFNNSPSDWAVDFSAALESTFGDSFNLGADQFVVSSGNSHFTYFSFAIPDTSVSWEFGTFVDASITSPSSVEKIGPIFRSTFSIDGLFVANGFDWMAVNALTTTVTDIWSALSPCADALGGVIPGAALWDAANRFADAQEEIRDLEAAGRWGEAHELQMEAYMDLSASTGEEVGPALLDHLCGDPRCSVVMTVLIEFYTGRIARDCFNQEFGLNGLSGGNKDSGKSLAAGTLVDSLSTWYRIPMERPESQAVDALFVEGRADVTARFQTIWARRDSTGLLPVEIAPIDTVGIIAMVGPNVRGFRDDPSANPDSEVELLIESQVDGPLNVALNHRISTGEIITFRYPEVQLTALGSALLSVDSNSRYPTLEVDVDGDGIVDQTIHPNSAADIPSSHAVAQLGQAYPNPFNPSTSISFSVSDPTRISLSVFDLQGRHIATLATGDYEVGEYKVDWNGCDDKGRQIASGVYLYRLDAGGVSESKRVVMLK